MPLNDAVNEGASNYNSESESMMEKEDKDASTKHETLRDTLNHVILAQQSALEILTNLCCDDSNYEDCSETDDDEDDMNGKVHIFSEGYKILRNLHRRFVLRSNSQIYGGDFAKFCGLLSIHELYILLLY